MPRNISNRIRTRLKQIAANPYAKHNNVTKLQGRPGFRLRVGDWRVIYRVKDEEIVILVLKIGPRGSVYR